MADETTEKRVEKLRKLLALSNSPNAEEAQSAMAMAYRLMAEWGISHAQVSDDEQLRAGYVRRVKFEGRTEPAWTRLAGSLVERFFDVKVVMRLVDRRPKHGVYIEIIGRAERVVVAEYVYAYLVAAYKRLYRRYRDDINAEFKAGLREKGIEAHDQVTKRSYFAGLTWGIETRLEEERRKVADERQAEHVAKGGTGLVPVVADPNLERAALVLLKVKSIPKPEPFEPGDQSAMVAGYWDGKATPVNPAIEGNTEGASKAGAILHELEPHLPGQAQVVCIAPGDIKPYAILLKPAKRHVRAFLSINMLWEREPAVPTRFFKLRTQYATVDEAIATYQQWRKSPGPWGHMDPYVTDPLQTKADLDEVLRRAEENERHRRDEERKSDAFRRHFGGGLTW